MKRIISFTLTVMMLPGLHSKVQPFSADDPIRLVVSQGIEAASCQLQYSLVGSFGGYGGFARQKLNASEFEIETVHEGAAAESLKAVIYCPGYQLQTMTLDPLPAPAARTVQLDLKPLGTVRFVGSVRELISQDSQTLYVDVEYMPWWICELFRLPDCLLSGWRIASVKLDTGGKFSIMLPDLARDTVIRAFKNPGEFAFRIRDQKTGNRLFELKPIRNRSSVGAVPVANGYPGVQFFDPEVPK
jgi:hypothetical protein